MRRINNGWDATAFGQRLTHYFNREAFRPICNSKATFCANPEMRYYPYGKPCVKCLELLYKGVDNIAKE